MKRKSPLLSHQIISLMILYVFTGISLFAQPKDNLNLLDIYELEYISDPQISPDGNQILYVRNFKDIMTDRNLSNIWIVNFDGTNNRPLTTGNQRDWNPRWVSGENKIVYLSNKDGSSQLYLKWLDNPSEQKLTNAQSTPGNMSISPDGKRIAFTMFVKQTQESFIKMPPKPEGAKWNTPPTYIEEMNYKSDGQGFLKPGNTHIFLMNTSGGTPVQLTSGKFDYGAPTWSKDQQSIFFSANLKENGELDPLNSEIYQIDISNKKIAQLTDRQGPDRSPLVSPDGSKIAYLGFDDKLLGYQINELYVMNTDGSSRKHVSGKLDRSVNAISWSEKGDGLYFMYDDKGDRKIAFMDLKGKVEDLIGGVGGNSLGRPYSSGGFSVSGNGKYAYTWGSSYHPSELGSGRGKSSQKITDINGDLLERKKLGKVEEIWWKSSHDKRDIQGWIVYPPDFNPEKKYPLLLEIHGGPFASYSPFFAMEIQLYASAGYVVLYSNPRGSASYGMEFGNLIHHNYPGQDYDDLMSGVDAVIKKGFIDENNMMVTGGSGGGVLTAWIIGKTDRFQAAVVAKPVINWYSHVLYADNPAFFYKYWFPGVPWENTEHYMSRSPISLVGNVNTPAMLLTGEEDHRTPMGESEQYFSALKIQGKEAALVRIPNASHGIASQPSNLVAKVAAILGWFEKHKNSSINTTIESK